MINIHEHSFKRTMLKIGVAMLIFLALLNTLFTVLGIVFMDINDSVALNVTYELLYALFYLASFIVPAIILNIMMGKNKKPMMLEKKIPIDIAVYIFATISVVLAVSYVNYYIIVNFFEYSKFSSSVLWGNEKLENYQVVLMFITTAIAPAFAEEFLFRGAIFSALKPYGKMPTIFITAVLFAFMHQNIEQLLYTFAAGLVLAWVVYETGSIWSSIIIHLFNNFVSVISTPISDRFPESTASIILTIIELSIFALGIISIAYIIIRKLIIRKNQKRMTGIYGVPVQDINESDRVEHNIKPGKVVKYFFSPTIIVFLVISILTMGLFIIQSIMYNAGLL